MALLIETHPHPAQPLRPAGRSSHPVPAGGVLYFPGAPDGIAPPAQLGPMMTPPSRGALFGR